MSQIEAAAPSTELDLRARHLPATPSTGFVIGSTEPIAPALRRVTTEQFTIAIDALGDPGDDLALAVAAARGALMRIAATLRLVRAPIGADVYRRETGVLQEIDDQLARLVTGEGELRALDDLRSQYASVLRPDTFTELREELIRVDRVRRLAAMTAMEADGEMPRVLHRLRRARARFGAWPGDADDAAADARALPDSFSVLAEGLTRTYRKGRRRWQAVADGGDSDPRRWARDVRDLGCQLQLLATAWPEVLAGAVGACRQLDAVLGDARDHGSLRARVDTGPRSTLTAEQTLLVALCDRARVDLRDISSVLGARVYAERPSSFVTRIGTYWAARV